MTSPASTEAPFEIGAGFDRRDADSIVATLASLVAAPEAPDPPPPWLRDHQVRPFRRAVAALRQHWGALVALPVGTGKTYVALAAGGAIAAEPMGVVAPAILEEQWQRVARSLGVAISFRSHEAMRRGHPAPPGPVVVVDESHRFRNPVTQRYRALAPQLIGRRALLLTATPVVNRLADLTHQLRLAVPDDALRLDGIPSLGGALEASLPPAALNRLVITGRRPTPGVPLRLPTRTIDWGRDDAGLARTVRSLDRLRLARDPAIAALVRSSFQRALASSPAALIASLRRYRRLLAHAADARRGGHPVNRAAIRAVIGADPDQLVWWELLEADPARVDLALGDLGSIRRLEGQLLARGEDDGKARHLEALLADSTPTIVFATAVETVRSLRNRLAGTAVGWLTGSRAGIGPLAASRAAVLRNFSPGLSATGVRPLRVLLATDVAAEGLDLQRAGRIVHYDLPWTSVRLEQRDGRAIRDGSEHAAVEVVRFAIPAALEARLALEAALDRKSVLPTRIGLAADAATIFAVGDRLAARWPGAVTTGWSEARGAAAVAGFRLVDEAGQTGALILARVGPGAWSADWAVVERALELAMAGTPTSPALAEVLGSLETPVVEALATITGHSLFSAPIPGRILAELHATTARCRRDRRDLDLDRLSEGRAAVLVTATLVALIC